MLRKQLQQVMEVIYNVKTNQTRKKETFYKKFLTIPPDKKENSDWTSNKTTFLNRLL